MNDLVALIKHNEELKEEIDRQCNVVENSRNVVKELETTITEKTAEIQQQKHEIRKLSSVVIATEGGSRMESDLDRYGQVKEIGEDLQSRIDDLESINSELRAKLDEQEGTKDSITKQFNKMKQKLEFEREQNAELNRQILEVSDLYDTYYTKCGELEKGRINGIDSPMGEQEKENDVMQSSSDDLVLTQQDLEHASMEDMLASHGSGESMKTSSGDDVESEQTSLSKKASSEEEKLKSKKQTSSNSDTQPQRKDESVLLAIVSLTKLLFLVTATFFIVTTLRVHYGFSVGQILSTVFATYVFLYNLWRTLPKGKQSGNDKDEPNRITQKNSSSNARFNIAP